LRPYLADPRLTRRLFDWGAWGYGLYTDQATWKASIGELVRHFPPTAEPPRILDLGCGPGVSALEFSRRLPEARIMGMDIAAGMLRQAQRYAARDGLAGRIPWLQADATRLPFASDSLDVVTGHSFLYLVPDRQGVLAEAYRVLRPGGRIVLMEPSDRRFDWRVLRRALDEFRFVLSAVLWHFYSRVHGPFTPASLAETLREAGFAHILAEEALNGMGLIGRGGKGALDVQQEASRAGQPQALPLQRTAPYLYLLITQKPNRPGWQPADEGEITWEAQAVTERGSGQLVLLAFTSLVKAVAFMQPAVMAGLVRDVNKVGKFRRETVEAWGIPFVINPSLEELRTPKSDYAMSGGTVRVEHRQRERHEEVG
jgi:ubiquinone/menaquinone biosynthesis C-methylase UbiE